MLKSDAKRILIVGSGAREHALAWKLAFSRPKPELLCAPGNAGTASIGRNLPLDSRDIRALAEAAVAERVDLVVVGPELPLALGLCDLVAEISGGAGRVIPCFGPRMAAAEIESSKSFAKGFMARHAIPTAECRIFTDIAPALEFCRSAPWPFVIKASGLASGKGVFLPASIPEAESVLRSLMRDSALGSAGSEIVVEERLEGPELSLLAFCDGRDFVAMPPSRDHKRLLDGDSGPNTGGMGAIAPLPDCTEKQAGEYAEIFIRQALDGLRGEGREFRGVLYAGLILTSSGPKALEYNCRFGDPEAEAILPLFDGDLVRAMESCASGALDRSAFGWKSGSCAAVVVASEGYPESPRSGVALRDLNPPSDSRLVFLGSATASVTATGTETKSAGGRTLCVSALGATLDGAIEAAYSGVARVDFPGAVFRRDIGTSTLAATRGPAAHGSAYAAAGVDIDSGDRAVELMAAAVKSTYDERVLAGIGSFGGLYDASFMKAMRDPVLVASTDGVGTKVKLAARAAGWRGIGMDIVNHCIGDILVQGARPLFFLDYFAASKLDPSQTASIVGGMAEACRASGCVLIGGETAEMPGVYEKGEFDVAGTIVGIVERSKILPAAGLREGDLLVGLRSASPHTNGYSLARRVFEGADLSAPLPEASGGPDAEIPLGELLLKPHRSYLPVLEKALAADPSPVKALAHITGGGFVGNIPRILPDDLDAVVRPGSWPVPALYAAIAARGGVDGAEMHRVFNMGIGMVAVVSPNGLGAFRALLDEECHVIGELVAGSGKARLA